MAAMEVAGFPLRNPVSATTHLLWFGLAVFLTAVFWKLTQGSRLRRWSTLTFGVSMCLLYGASGLYHSLRVNQKTLEFFRLLDHSMIYVLIAGTFTPICAMLLHGRQRISLLVLIWGLAVIGIACKWLFAAPPYPVTVAMYIGMGWIGVIPMRQLFQALGPRGMAWVLLGGILYTAGGVCDAVKWPLLWPGLFGPHEVLHVCDMAATVVHVYVLLCFILPYRPAWEAPILRAA
jgi:hemolysin III